MHIVIGSIIVIVLLYIIGKLIYKDSDRHLSFIKILGTFFFIMVSNALIMLVTLLTFFVVGLYFLPESVYEENFKGQKFSTGMFLLILLIFILLTAIIHHLLRRYFLKKYPRFRLTEEGYEICEYFIQWMTIYVVVYQFLFDGLSSLLTLEVDKDIVKSMFSVILTPNNINLVVQPLLIATWIVVVIEKLKYRNK